MAKIPIYQQIAAELQAAIEDGTYLPGAQLMTITELAEAHDVNALTAREAYKWLEDEGYVVLLKRHGTIVRDRTRIRVSLSRYSSVMAPGGTKGPWETATAALGMDGRMVMVDVGTVTADPETATTLGLEPSTQVHRRRRRAMIGDELHHLQSAWYPLDVSNRAGLTSTQTIIGGIYGAMTGAGWPPVELDETVSARMPTQPEADALRIGKRVPVLLVDRVTRDATGRAIERLHVMGPADRIELVYEHLPLIRGGS
ncbi:GntR family transcriptional regulator [Catenulispora yoronensis]